MEQEAGETSGDDRVSYPEIPCRPLSLKPVEFAKVGSGIEQLCALVERRCRVGPRHVEEGRAECQRQAVCTGECGVEGRLGDDDR
jgi:hypothetical protein